jgi:hypothetical protein
VRRAGALLAVLVLAGCGGTAERAKPKEPRLPRDLAQSWARESDGIAQQLAAGDTCGAQQRAYLLQQQFVLAVNEHRVPARLQEPLGAAVGDLQSRIKCVMPKPAPPEEKPKDEGKKHDHGKHKGHD